MAIDNGQALNGEHAMFDDLDDVSSGQSVDELVTKGEVIKLPIRESSMGHLLRNPSELRSQVAEAEGPQGMPKVAQEGSMFEYQDWQGV